MNVKINKNQDVSHAVNQIPEPRAITKVFPPLSAFPNFLWRGMSKRIWPGIRFIFTGRCPKTCQLLPSSKWFEKIEEIVGYKNKFPPNFFSEETKKDLNLK